MEHFSSINFRQLGSFVEDILFALDNLYQVDLLHPELHKGCRES